MTFNDTGLNAEVLRAVSEAGYDVPTPIQAQAIPLILQGRDMIGIAQTGTGKTAAFTLPMIDILSRGQGRARMARTLILEPTRELAMQIAENFKTYGKYQKLSHALLIGGVSIGAQFTALARGADVLIATPGRLIDHIERGKILLNGIQILVIDEADRMLDMGFIPAIEKIASLLPKQRQTLLFSATMPPPIERLAGQFMRSPERIAASQGREAADNVRQILAWTDERSKISILMAHLRASKGNALVFCNRKRDVDRIERALKAKRFNAEALHGGMAQYRRAQVLLKFRNNKLDVLVASNVAARGLDIADVAHVINFDVPHHAEDYVHRIGRTGRAGASGDALTLATGEEIDYVKAIEKFIGDEVPVHPDHAAVPTPQPRTDRGAPKRSARRPARRPERKGVKGARTKSAHAKSAHPKDARAKDARAKDARGKKGTEKKAASKAGSKPRRPSRRPARNKAS